MIHPRNLKKDQVLKVNFVENQLPFFLSIIPVLGQPGDIAQIGFKAYPICSMRPKLEDHLIADLNSAEEILTDIELFHTPDRLDRNLVTAEHVD